MASKKKEQETEKKPVNNRTLSNIDNQFGEASSIDKVALNNKIISMRSIVKKSRVRILAKLIRHIKDLNQKIKEKPVNLEKNKRKLSNLLEEMKVIKALKSDTISRFALGNTYTFVELNNKGFQSTEARALARFSDERLLQDVVKKFHAEHSDWKSLAAFVQTQSSGRHIKKKNKGRNKQKEETKANIKAKQIIVSNFIHGKVDIDSTNVDFNSESNIIKSHVTNVKSSLNTKQMNSNEEFVSKDFHLRSNNSKLDANQERSDSEKIDSKNSNANIQKSKKDHNSPNKISKLSNESKKSESKSLLKKEPVKDSPQNVVMVVKKINLHNFEDNISIEKMPPKKDTTEKLLGAESNKEELSDLFFATDQDAFITEKDEKNILETLDQENDDDSELTVSGNHSMFLSLSGRERTEREKINFQDHFSDFKRQKPNTQRYQNSHRNNFVHGHFPNGGRKVNISSYSVKKTCKQSKENPSKNTSKQRLSDTSNLSGQKLHPSWEASRKRKEQAANISAFQGKKITFDD